jgi:hypothetical protein
VVNITRALKQTQTTNPRRGDAELRTRRLSSLDAWGISHQLLLGTTQEADGDHRARTRVLVKESEEGRRSETLVARLNNMSATWRMTSLGVQAEENPLQISRRRAPTSRDLQEIDLCLHSIQVSQV